MKGINTSLAIYVKIYDKHIFLFATQIETFLINQFAETLFYSIVPVTFLAQHMCSASIINQSGDWETDQLYRPIFFFFFLAWSP